MLSLTLSFNPLFSLSFRLRTDSSLTRSAVLCMCCQLPLLMFCLLTLLLALTNYPQVFGLCFFLKFCLCWTSAVSLACLENVFVFLNSFGNINCAFRLADRQTWILPVFMHWAMAVAPLFLLKVFTSLLGHSFKVSWCVLFRIFPSLFNFLSVLVIQ